MKKIITNFVAIAFLMFITSCEFNFSTANIDDVKMCTSINDNQCGSDNPNFTPSTPEIFISCHLKNAPENTEVEFAWFFYGQEKIAIDVVKLNSGDQIGTLNLQSSFSRPNNGWPVGEYEVIITILGTEKEPVVKKFWVQ